MTLQIYFLILTNVRDNKLYKVENSYVISSTPTAFL